MDLNPNEAVAVLARYLGKEYARPNGCFVNVAAAIRDHGGSAVFGWLAGERLLPERPVIQTWVHHCVWRAPDGELAELSPQVQGSLDGGRYVAALPNVVVFLPDDSATLVPVADGLVAPRLQPLHGPDR